MVVFSTFVHKRVHTHIEHQMQIWIATQRSKYTDCVLIILKMEIENVCVQQYLICLLLYCARSLFHFGFRMVYVVPKKILFVISPSFIRLTI